MKQFTKTKIQRILPGVLILLSVMGPLMLMGGCARKPVEVMVPVIFPNPPAKARVQFLGSIKTTKDLPQTQGSFADFILGPKPVRYPLVKPISAALKGNLLYVCDTVINTVYVYDLVTGDARRLMGDQGIGKINQPNNLVFDKDGKLYIADKLRGSVLIYDQNEDFIDAWGKPNELGPVAVSINGDELFVCDILNHRIEVWDKSDGSLLRIIGEKGNEPGQFLYPTQLAHDAEGNLYVTDTGNCRIQRFDPEGNVTLTIGKFGRELGDFAWPKGMDVDDQGRIYVADSRFANVQIFDSEGHLLLFFGGPTPGLGNLDLPAGLRVYKWQGEEFSWLASRLVEDFNPGYLVIVISQKGEGLINFFAVAKDDEEVQ